MDLKASWEHFARADWAAARDGFAAVLAQDAGDAEALDGLGQALWWLGERDAAIANRRDAYAAYQRRGDARRAGGLATYLAAEHRIDGQGAAAAGWLARARRLLEGQEATPERGWLAIEEAKRATDPEAAASHARHALALAHDLANPDVECMALAQLGRATVAQGRVDEGVALLDEAMTVALGGETNDPLACGDACCTTLVVCDGLADLDRAAQWCEVVVDFIDRRRFNPVQSWCRGIFGGVLLRAGDWARAEAVLVEALARAANPRRGTGRALPLAVLAELRIRQGRVDEAEHLVAGLEDEPAATGPVVALHLQRRELALADAVLDRRAQAIGEDGASLALRGSLRSLAGTRPQPRRSRSGSRSSGACRRARTSAQRRPRSRAGRRPCAATPTRPGSPSTTQPRASRRCACPSRRLAPGSRSPRSTPRRGRRWRRGSRRRRSCLRAPRAPALTPTGGCGAATPGQGRGGPRTAGPRDELTAREREVLRLVATGCRTRRSPTGS
jgi:hypothetical protein